MKHLNLLALALLPLLSAAEPPPELSALRQQYDKVISERITAPFDTQARELNLKFTAALEKAALDINKTGNLEAALAVQEDIKRLGTGVPVPEDDDKTPEALKKLRAIYREQLGKLVSKRDADYGLLLPGYTAKLQEIESFLVKANRVEDARQTKDFRESLLLATAAPRTAAASGSTLDKTASTPNAAAPAVSTSAGEANKQFVDWCLNNGHAVEVQAGRRLVHVTTAQELPKEKFQIVKVNYESALPKRNPGPFSWPWLDSCPDLKGLFLDFDDQTEISMTDLAHLAALKELETFQIGGECFYPGFDLQQFPALPSLTKLTFSIATKSGDIPTLRLKFPKLTSMTFAYTKVDPSTLEQLSSWKGFSEIRLDGSSAELTAAHIMALGQCKDLRSMVFYPAKSLIDPSIKNLAQLETLWISYDILPESFSALCSLPNIKNLTINGNTHLTDTELGQMSKLANLTELRLWNLKMATDALIPHLAQLKDLTALDMDGTPITDAGLVEATKLKKLRKIYVRKCATTEAGASAFTKKRPEVRLTR